MLTIDLNPSFYMSIYEKWLRCAPKHLQSPENATFFVKYWWLIYQSLTL